MNSEHIGVTAFKARCLALIEQVAEGRTERVVLLKRGEPVAEIVPVQRPRPSLHGALRGTVTVAPGVDLTEATGEIWDAEA
ncbi:MAG: hypothetical protein K2X11_13630 [Acetobacteraceae bacterium]|nr:hypothetical protein [Acetobacteraceae bacterium]